MNKTVDARGMACPLPVVSAKKAAEEMPQGGTLTVLADNEIAVQNLSRFADHMGYAVACEKTDERCFSVVMQVTPPTAQPPAQEDTPACTPDARQKGLLVALSADTMGAGDDALGRALMKAFVFALTRQDQLPETILCYNGGAALTCEGADTLEDLRALEAEGVTILTCGTCLDFYGFKDKLAVGGVTNMYDIVERLQAASRIIRP